MTPLGRQDTRRSRNVVNIGGKVEKVRILKDMDALGGSRYFWNAFRTVTTRAFDVKKWILIIGVCFLLMFAGTATAASDPVGGTEPIPQENPTTTIPDNNTAPPTIGAPEEPERKDPTSIGKGSDASVSPDGISPSSTSTIQGDYIIDRTPQTIGKVNVTYNVTIPNDVDGVAVRLNYSGRPDYSVASTDGFSYNPSEDRWDAINKTQASLTYTIDANTTFGLFGSGKETVETNEWALLGPSQLRFGRFYFSNSQAEFKETGSAVREGYVGNNEDFAFLGSADTFQQSAPGQELTLVVPDAANPNTTVDNILSNFTAVSTFLQVGDRDPNVTAFVPPDPIRRGGRATGSSFWARGDGLIFILTHEYVHTRQAWLDADLPSEEDSTIEWITEGSADYYQGYIPWELNERSDSQRFRNYLATDQNSSEVLQDDDANSAELKNYNKGRRVLGALDIRIRQNTDGNQTLATIFSRLNEKDGTFSYSDFKSEAVSLTNSSTGPWLDEYVTTSSAPPIPQDIEAAYSPGLTEVDSCREISSSGTYELQSDVSSGSTCIEITADNVTFDGNGNIINGSGSVSGVYVNGPVTDVTVKNVETRNWGRGIWLENASQVEVLNNTVENNTDGIHVTYSDNNSIRGNRISSNQNGGLRLRLSSDRNRVVNNKLTLSGEAGIVIDTFSIDGGPAIENLNNTVVGNNVSETGSDASGTDGTGILLGGAINNTVEHNTVTDTNSAGILLFDGSFENTVQKNTVESGNLSGIGIVDSSNNNTVQSNTAESNNGSGVFVRNSSDNTIQGNLVNSNDIGGVSLLNSSSGNIIRNNTAKFNGLSGIGAGGEPYTRNNRNVIENNTANSNDWIGIGWVGSNNTIENNTAYNNAEYGIGLGVLSSNNNELIGNDIQFNDVGLILNASSEDNVGIDNIIENNTEAIVTEEGAEVLRQSGGDSDTSTTTTTVSSLGITEDQEAAGTLNQEQKENAIRNNSAENSDVAFRTSNGAPTAVGPLNIGNSSKPDTRVLLEGENVSVRPVENPPDNPNAMSIGRYLNATEETNDSFLNMGIRYTEDDLGEGLNESSLSIWKHNGTEWREIGSSVNTTENVVNTGVTDFSTFGVFAEATATDPAFFDVNITGTNSPVAEGEKLTVDVNVTNTGDEKATQTLNLTDTGFNNNEQDTVDVTLNGGEFNNSITLDWSTSEGDNGTGNVTVFSENDSDTESVTVNDTNTAPTAQDQTYSKAENTNTLTKDLVALAADDVDDSDSDLDVASIDSGNSSTDTVTADYQNTLVELQASITGSSNDKIEFVPTNLNALDVDDANANGVVPFTFDYRIEDDSGTVSGQKQVTVEVVPDNDAPAALSLSSTTVEQSAGLNAVVGSFTTTDVDDSSHTYSLVSGTGDGDNDQFNINSGDLRADDASTLAEGTYKVRVETADGNGGTFEKTFSISVNDDVAPTLSSSTPADGSTGHNPVDDLTLNFSEDIQFGSGNIVLNDVDGGTTEETFDVTSDTGGGDGTVSISGDTLTINPTSNLQSGNEYAVQIDGTAIEDTASTPNSYVGISNDDDLDFTTADTDPIFTEGSLTSVTVSEDGSVDLTSALEVSDISSTDTLTWSVESAPSNGALRGIDGETLNTDGSNSPFTLGTSPTYSPAPDVNGADSFDVQISDTNPGNSPDTITVSVTIDAVNDPPTANNDSASTNQDTNVTVDVVANDTDVDDDQSQLDVTAITDGPSHGTAQITGTSNDKIEFTPGPGATSDVQITYEVSDDDGAMDTATLSVTVNAVNTPPMASDDSDDTNEGQSTTTDVLANDSDPDGSLDTSTVTVQSGPSDGSVGVDDTTGAITYTPDSGFTGTDSYTYTVRDDDGAESNEATVTITVDAVNTAFFDVNVTGTNSPVTEGDTLEVTTNVTNAGDESDNQVIKLDASGLGTNSMSVSLNSGSSTTMTLSVGTAAGDAGSYTATVSSDNDTDTSGVTVREPNTPPAANFTFAPENPSTADTIEFNASGSTDSDGSIMDYAWDFGDGSTGRGETVTHSYDNPGSFSVTLDVTDDDGATNSTTQFIVVDEETFENEEGCINRRGVSRGEEDRACPSDEGTQRRDRGRGEDDGETDERERRDRSRRGDSRGTDRRRNRGRGSR